MTTSDRPAVKRQIVSVLADALPGVQVAYAYPGGATRNEVVWLGDVTGSQELVAMGSSRLPRNDNWTLEVVVAVTEPKVEEEVVAAPAAPAADDKKKGKGKK